MRRFDALVLAGAVALVLAPIPCYSADPATPPSPTLPPVFPASATATPPSALAADTVPKPGAAIPIPPAIGTADALPSAVTMPPLAGPDGKPLPDAQNFVPSYRDWTESLMFPDPGISNLKKLLARYELYHLSESQSAATPLTPQTAAVDQLLQRIDKNDKTQAPAPPPPYPVFRLGSIVLDPRNGSSIALNGKILPPGVASGDVEVTSVTPTSASFVWKPSNPLLAQQVQKDVQARQAAGNRETAAPNRERLAALIPGRNISNSPVSVRFTLHPNQSFTPQFMAIYEGAAPGTPPATTASLAGQTPAPALNAVPSAIGAKGMPVAAAAPVNPYPSMAPLPGHATGSETPATSGSAPVPNFNPPPVVAAATPVAATPSPANPTVTGVAGRSANMADTTPAAVSVRVDPNAPATTVQTPATPLKSVSEIASDVPGGPPVIVSSPATLPSVNSIP